MEEIQNSPTRVYKAYFSGIFGVLASTLLVALSCLNAWNARLAPGDAEKPLRAVAVVEMTHAISCYILLFPLIQDCICRSQLRPMAIQMSRGAGFVLSLTGISLILASLPYDRSDLYPPASGLMILVLSCISLMTSYWPDRGEDSYRTAAMRDAPPPLDTGIVDSTPLLTEEGTNDGLSDIEQGSTDCGRADDTATESGCNECPLPAELFEGTDFDRQYQLGKEVSALLMCARKQLVEDV